MTEPGNVSPLAGAALALVGPDASAAELRDRFARAGSAIDIAVAQDLLDQLCALGLLRVARGTGPDRRYVPTTLGGQVNALASDGWETGRGSRAVAALLRDLERMRTDLLSTIAHELRTPLTAIRTSIGLLRDPASNPTPEQHAQLLETIERNAERMQRLVADSLELTRFRAGRIHLQLRRFDAAELARSVARTIPDLERTVALDLPDAPVWVFGDHRRLEQALVNLVSNADRYSPRGAPIRMSVEAAGSDVRWTVEDQGRGIAIADRARIFERFFVGRGDRAGESEGVGLGLPITLAIVQAHDGRIDVDSEVGRGSRFSITVPAAGPSGSAEP